jgi:PAS domain S-box-containing protein
VGSINVGYGDPPRDPAKLQEIAERYGVSVEELLEQAAAYESRPPYIIDFVKSRLPGSARLIGEITERRRIEEALRNSESRWRSLSETSPDHILLLDTDLRIEFANFASPGLTVEELIGTPLYTLVDEASQAEVRAILENVLRTGAPAHYETVYHLPDGGERNYESRVAARTLSGSDQAIGLTLSARDITERKQAEVALRKARDELERRVQERTRDLTRLNEELLALSHAERRQRQLAQALVEAATALSSSLDLDEVLDRILEQIQRVSSCRAVALMLVQDGRAHVSRLRDFEDTPETPQILQSSFSVNSFPPLETMSRLRQPVVAEDTEADPQWQCIPGFEWARSYAGVPMQAGQQIVGFLNIFGEEPFLLSSESRGLLEAFAAHAAVAVQNAWLFEQVRAGRQRLQALTRRLVEVQEAERRYVARELHDETGQVLTSLMVGLRLLEREADRPEAVVAGVAELRRMLDDVMEDLHRLAMDLRPASLDYLGLEAALRQYVEAVSDKHGLVAQFEAVRLIERLAPDVEAALYRIVQEALTNVIRHAQATRVDVLLEQNGDKLVVIVEDNGVGFDPATALQGRHMGLLGMRERAEMLGGTLALESAAGAGTTVLVEVPHGNSGTHRR